jgi:hypothetical protein
MEMEARGYNREEWTSAVGVAKVLTGPRRQDARK